MAKADIKVKFEFTRYCLLFLPIASLVKVGDCCAVKLFGVPIYKQSGSAKKILFWKYNG